MKRIKQIFDGDYGCEENTHAPGERTVSVTLEDEEGNLSYETVPDAWLRQNALDVGSVWPEGVARQNRSAKNDKY